MNTTPQILPLEPRRMLAFSTGFVGGVFRVVAAAGVTPVDIRISLSLDNFRITDANDGTSEDIPVSSVGAIALFGASGNDRLRIDGNIFRNVTINGGLGNDTFVGGGGKDVIIGGGGTDTVDYSVYSAKLNISLDGVANDGPGGNVDVDNVSTDVENVLGGANNDVITGNASANVLQGLGGKDTIRGGAGNDTLSGGNKNDLLYADDGQDFLVGAAGVDALSYESRDEAVSVTLDGVANDGASGEKDNVAGTVERFILGDGDDFFVGTGRSQIVTGGPGNDTIRGGGGGDSLTGGPGRDSILGEGGDDVIFARDTEIDTVSGGSGVDIAERDDADVVTAVP